MQTTTQSIQIPEQNKKEGLSYAVTADGIELPVIDVRHPAFALEAAGPELDAIMDKTVRDLARRARIPAFIQKPLLRRMLRGSLLAQAIGRANGAYLCGIGTYLLKLGPENLGAGYAVKVDRALAASLPCLSVRYRLRDTAALLADYVNAALAARPRVGVSEPGEILFFNIAGGAASDSLNALMILNRVAPDSLEGRKIRIAVLEIDEEGPIFGGRALAALLENGGALAGLDIELRRVAYDWRDTSALPGLLGGIDEGRDVVAFSSEGGLFEYGSDEDIAANLRGLAALAPAGSAFVGTMSIAEGAAGRVNEAGGAAIRLRRLEDMVRLADDSGWRMDRVVECPLSRTFELRASG